VGLSLCFLFFCLCGVQETRAKDVEFEASTGHFKVVVSGKVLLEGEPYTTIKPADGIDDWELEKSDDGLQIIILNLHKAKKTGAARDQWPCAIKGHAVVDIGEATFLSDVGNDFPIPFADVAKLDNMIDGEWVHVSPRGNSE